MAAGRIKGITVEIGGDTTKDPVLGIRQTFFSRLWFRQIQDLKDLVTCCHSIHCDMEKGTEQTKGCN